MIWFPISLFIILIFLGCTYIPREKLSAGFFCASVMTLVSAFLVCFLYSFIKGYLPLSESEKGIYLHYLIHDHIFFFYPGIITASICLLPGRKDAVKSEIFAKSFVLMALFMFMAMLSKFYYSQHSWWGDPYVVFITPLFMLLECFGFALLYQIKTKIIAFSYMWALPFGTAFISALYYTRRAGLSIAVLGACYLVAFTFAFFLYKKEKKA